MAVRSRSSFAGRRMFCSCQNGSTDCNSFRRCALVGYERVGHLRRNPASAFALQARRARGGGCAGPDRRNPARQSPTVRRPPGARTHGRAEELGAGLTAPAQAQAERGRALGVAVSAGAVSRPVDAGRPSGRHVRRRFCDELTSPAAAPLSRAGSDSPDAHQLQAATSRPRWRGPAGGWSEPAGCWPGPARTGACRPGRRPRPRPGLRGRGRR